MLHLFPFQELEFPEENCTLLFSLLQAAAANRPSRATHGWRCASLCVTGSSLARFRVDPINSYIGRAEIYIARYKGGICTCRNDWICKHVVGRGSGRGVPHQVSCVLMRKLSRAHGITPACLRSFIIMGASMTSQAQLDARAGSDGCSGGGHPRSSSNCRAFARGLQVRLLLSDGGFCCVCGCEHGHGSSLQRADKARQEPKAKAEAKANKSRATQKCWKTFETSSWKLL